MVDDSRIQLSAQDLPTQIENLKDLMGICKVPDNPNHFLFDFFMEYERWRGLIYGHKPIPPRVIELGQYAVAVGLFKDDWSDIGVRELVKKKLVDPNEVRGILFEFRTGVHFLHQHRQVQWMPNMDSNSEFDLRVTTGSAATVSVECTRKQEKPSRLDDPKEMRKDIVRALRDKRRQIARRTATDSEASLVAVLIPEQVDLKGLHHIRKSVNYQIEKLFDKDEYSIISGFAVVCYAPPTKTIPNSDIVVYDTGLPVLQYKNPNARQPFPTDFYPILV